MYTFSPPTYEVGWTDAPLFRYYRKTVADSVVRVNGTLQTVKVPSQEQLSSLVEGIDYFRGGYIYENLSQATRDELVAAGFTVQG